MADTNYTLTTTYTQPTAWESNTGNTALNVTCRLAASTNRKASNGFYFNSVGVDGVYSWRVSGKVSVGRETLYQRAMVQLAVSATDEALETCTGVLADVATLKSHEVIEFQAPTAQNNYTWYRKYADGWVEQGGITEGEHPATVTHTMNLPVTMADTNYFVNICSWANNTNNTDVVQVSYSYAFHGTVWGNSKSTTSFQYRSEPNGMWEVKGMYAQ
jgi:hypothetical protein